MVYNEPLMLTFWGRLVMLVECPKDGENMLVLSLHGMVADKQCAELWKQCNLTSTTTDLNLGQVIAQRSAFLMRVEAIASSKASLQVRLRML